MDKLKKDHRQGFTLIEIMVEIALMAIVMVTATQILTVIVRSNIKTRAIMETKQAGDHALLTMVQQLRNATGISSCPGPSITFDDSLGVETTITCAEVGITMGGEDLITSDLTVSGFDSCFTCVPGTAGTPDAVSIAFTLHKEPGAVLEGFDLSFSSNVSLRTYE